IKIPRDSEVFDKERFERAYHAYVEQVIHEISGKMERSDPAGLNERSGCLASPYCRIVQIIGRCNLTRHNVAETEQGFREADILGSNVTTTPPSSATPCDVRRMGQPPSA